MKTAPSPGLRQARKNRDGGILVTTLIMIAIMSMLAAATLYRVSSRYASTYQSVCWNEALSSAEAGADLALVSLNKSIAAPDTAWAAWTPGDATTFPKTYTPDIPSHTGDGNTKVYAKMEVDKIGTTGWFRVRSTGVAELPARSVNGLEAARADTDGVKNHRSVLRKANFLTDVTGGALQLPQMARTVEVLAMPSASKPYSRALLVKTTISLSSGSYTDSFDSSDPAYSTGGQYDYAKRLSHGDVATNGDGYYSNLQSMYVYGNAASNGGEIANTQHVTGSVTSNFQTVIADVAAPTLTNVQASPTIINGASATLAAGTAALPKSYILSQLTITSSQQVTLSNPTPGTDAYINIYITGNSGLSMAGASKIVQEAGVHANIYLAGNLIISGSGVVNKNNKASYLQVFGITPASGTKSATINGSASFIGILNAPAHTLNVSGSASFIGAAIAYNANVSGGAAMHYDQALSNGPGPTVATSYTYTNWAEDIR
jgi:hypothetical protein